MVESDPGVGASSRAFDVNSTPSVLDVDDVFIAVVVIVRATFSFIYRLVVVVSSFDNSRDSFDVYADGVGLAAADRGSSSCLRPSRGGKIGRFCNVESVVESRMVGFGKRDDDLSGSMDALRDVESVVSQEFGRHDGHFVSQKRGTRVCRVRKVFGGEPFESWSVFGRYRVPALGSSKVQYVDGVQVGIFDVPCEESAPGSDVEHGFGDTAELEIWRGVAQWIVLHRI